MIAFEPMTYSLSTFQESEGVQDQSEVFSTLFLPQEELASLSLPTIEEKKEEAVEASEDGIERGQAAACMSNLPEKTSEWLRNEEVIFLESGEKKPVKSLQQLSPLFHQDALNEKELDSPVFLEGFLSPSVQSPVVPVVPLRGLPFAYLQKIKLNQFEKNLEKRQETLFPQTLFSERPEEVHEKPFQGLSKLGEETSKPWHSRPFRLSEDHTDFVEKRDLTLAGKVEKVTVPWSSLEKALPGFEEKNVQVLKHLRQALPESSALKHADVLFFGVNQEKDQALGQVQEALRESWKTSWFPEDTHFSVEPGSFFSALPPQPNRFEPLLAMGLEKKEGMEKPQPLPEAFIQSVHTLVSKGGGQMRIRLHPEFLGELSIQVETQGNQVHLRVEVAREEIKTLVEESLHQLRDQLYVQNLQLKVADVALSDATLDAFSSSQGFSESWTNRGSGFSQEFQNHQSSQENPGEKLFFQTQNGKKSTLPFLKPFGKSHTASLLNMVV